MRDESTKGEARPGGAERPQESGAAAPGRGGRMSRQRKTAAVLRLLRGEDLETISRGLGVTAATLSRWRDAFHGDAERLQSFHRERQRSFRTLDVGEQGHGGLGQLSEMLAKVKPKNTRDPAFQPGPAQG